MVLHMKSADTGPATAFSKGFEKAGKHVWTCQRPVFIIGFERAGKSNSFENMCYASCFGGYCSRQTTLFNWIWGLPRANDIHPKWFWVNLMIFIHIHPSKMIFIMVFRRKVDGFIHFQSPTVWIQNTNWSRRLLHLEVNACGYSFRTASVSLTALGSACPLWASPRFQIFCSSSFKRFPVPLLSLSFIVSLCFSLLALTCLKTWDLPILYPVRQLHPGSNQEHAVTSIQKQHVHFHRRTDAVTI